MKNILVPTDFSGNATHAIRFALELSRKQKSKITLFHSFVLPVYATDIPVFPQADEELRKVSEEALSNLVSKLKNENPGVVIDSFVSQGYAEDEIVDAAKSSGADMIVMGTQGASGLREALVGTITASVMDHAECPIMAVPEGASFTSFDKIVYATSYAEGDFQHVEEIIDFARLFNAEVILLHISSGTVDTSYEFESIERFKERIVEDSQYERISFKLLENKSVYEGLNQFLEEVKADLVAMTLHKRSFVQKLFNRSITKRMAYHTHIPLIAFKTEEPI
ncbi:MAG: universal stress protein [Bacteroidetes bacterium]|nr:universal stress protein [Bacteroidota bacterium]